MLGDVQTAADIIIRTLQPKLASGQKVLWLLSGGSALVVATKVSEQIEVEHSKLLTVMLMDERFGPVDSPDSNWHGLERAGFQFKRMHAIPTLDGSDIEKTTYLFAKHFGKVFAETGYRIGLFGIGPDGHTAGILPHSPAVEAAGTATYYQSDPYTRITLTAESLARLDEAVVFAVGENKWPVLRQLEIEDLPLIEQPAQLVKHIKKTIVVTDYKGEIV